MEYRILGPLEVVEDGEAVPLGTLKERLVLGVLLLHANELVSRERLIDELWGVAPPATARKAVNVYVSKLRKSLGGNGQHPIATADGGYRLAVAPDLLDVARMGGLVATARERIADGDSETASRLLEEALAFWRGPTLAGLALESSGREEVAQLDELRLTVLMDRIDCDLALGRHEHVLGELQVLVGEHPLRERLRAQHMLALYRADRQADALEAYRRARHDLIDELGIEPSESLQRLQQAILRHDPALETPAGTASTNGAPLVSAPAQEAAPAPVPARSPERRALRRRHLVLTGLVALAAVAALAAFLSSRGSGVRPPSSPVSSIGPNGVARIDPATDKLLVVGGGGTKPGPMALVGRELWVVIRGDAQIGRIGLRAHHGMPPFQPAPSLDDIAVDPQGHVWVSDRKPFVTWIGHVRDGSGPYETPVPTTQRVPVRLPGAGAEAVGGGYLWVIADLPGRTGKSVALVDTRHRRFASKIPLGRQTTAIAYGYHSAWIGAYDQQDSTAWLLKVRPGSNQVQPLRLETADGEGPLAVAVGAGAVWVVTSHGNLLGIDPRTMQPTHRISMSAQLPTLLAVDAGSVWTTNQSGYSVSQIDPRTNKIVRTIPFGRYDATPCGILAAPDAVFVSSGETTCS